MNLGLLHKYLGDLIASGTGPKLPVVLPPGEYKDNPQELTTAMLVTGPYDGDPSPKMSAYTSRSGAALLLSGQRFDIDSLRESHNIAWPDVDTPEPNRCN
ncbi:hypothetical protein HN51_25405 [Ectopseudomonas mendocina]|uniref:Uncharacterized protein n=1 Tax=Ectopseudomonas mendocina S5.2 TaxID=1225174 RepID=A0ABN4J1I9_ECTME|nr:hypothetical protein DW68_024320 [Pseudomonas mendocina S5.2]KER98138.1 hypothetical protein HN51_25405 [Pseudomonas mendocina]